MEYATIVVMLALTQYMYFTMRAGFARGRLSVKAPACTGNEEFERIYRVHQNTNEQIIIFIPALYAFAYYVSPLWGPGIGVFYIIGRFIYCNSYLADPAKRGPGMMVTFLTNGILATGALIGAVLSLI